MLSDELMNRCKSELSWLALDVHFWIVHFVNNHVDPGFFLTDISAPYWAAAYASL